MNLLAQFSRGTFEYERTRAFILLALTKLHTALDFEPNDYVENIMDDYLSSRNLEVQTRCFDYKVLKSANSGPKVSDLIFKTPLTESQVTAENFDYDMKFLDQFVNH